MDMVLYALIKNKLKSLEPSIVYAEAETSVGGFAVPQITVEQFMNLYNAVVGGRDSVLVDKNNLCHYVINQADAVGDSLNIGFNYFDVMYLTYVLENNDISIEHRDFD